MLVMASKSVLASRKESKLQEVETSDEIVSKQEAIEGCKCVNLSKASMCSID